MPRLEKCPAGGGNSKVGSEGPRVALYLQYFILVRAFQLLIAARVSLPTHLRSGCDADYSSVSCHIWHYSWHLG